MNFENVIKNRCAIRKFKKEKVSNEIITKILEAGTLAPTAKNLQPQKIFVVESNEGLEKIDKASPCRYNAPICFIVACDKSKSFNKNNHSTYEIDASIVATHMMLEATNLGVDNIWIEMFDRDILKKEFKMEPDIEPIMIMPIGYRTEDCPVSPMHLIRKNLDEFVEYV